MASRFSPFIYPFVAEPGGLSLVRHLRVWRSWPAGSKLPSLSFTRHLRGGRWRPGWQDHSKRPAKSVSTSPSRTCPKGRIERLFSVGRTRRCYRPEHLFGLEDVTLDTSHVAASGLDLVETYTERDRHPLLASSWHPRMFRRQGRC